MTPDQLVAYYVNLLVMQYFGLPKASGTIAAFVRQAVASLIVLQVRGGFQLATAVGKQLDALGQLVGASRRVPGFTPAGGEFSMPRYADGGAGSYVGFARYDDSPPPNGHWARYSDIDSAYIMADALFAEFIRYLAAVRASNYSLAQLDAIFFAFFGALVTITDNENMTMTYTHDATHDPGVLFEIINFLNLLPHPAGVAVIVVET